MFLDGRWLRTGVTGMGVAREEGAGRMGVSTGEEGKEGLEASESDSGPSRGAVTSDPLASRGAGEGPCDSAHGVRRGMWVSKADTICDCSATNMHPNHSRIRTCLAAAVASRDWWSWIVEAAVAAAM